MIRTSIGRQSGSFSHAHPNISKTVYNIPSIDNIGLTANISTKKHTMSHNNMPVNLNNIENKNFILSCKKPLSKENFLFDELYLFGLSKHHNFRFVYKKA